MDRSFRSKVIIDLIIVRRHSRCRANESELNPRRTIEREEGKKEGGRGTGGEGGRKGKKGRKKKKKRDLVAATALYRAGCWIESIGRLLVGDTLF